MKKAFFPFILLMAAVSVMFYSCGKHVYAMNYKELGNLMEKAKEPGECFVQYVNGETLKGKSIKFKDIKGGGVMLMLDGKQVPDGDINSYQDKYAYYLLAGGTTEYPRVFNGKANLYLHQTDGRQIRQTYYKSTNSIKTQVAGSIQTTFFIGKGNSIEQCTMESFERNINDYPPALAQFKKEFPKYNRYMNDYRAFVRILNVYNQKP